MRKGIAVLAVSLCTALFCSGIAAAEEVWTSYTNKNDNFSIGVDGDYIWAGTSLGLYRWTIPTPGEDATYELFTDVIGKDYFVNTILIVGDVRWFAAEGMGLVKYQEGAWTVYSAEDTDLPNNWIWDMDVDTQGNLWLATSSGVSKFDGITWTNFTSADGLVSDFTDNIEIDNSNVVWCGSWSGLSSYSIETRTWSTYTTDNSGLPENSVADIAVDSLNRKWITTNSSGLVSWDGAEWKTFTTDNGLPTNNLGKLGIDGLGKLWIGAYSEGAFSFDLMNATVYNTGNGLSHNDIRDIAIGEDNTVWFASKMGINGFDGESWTTISDPMGPASNYINCVAIDGDNMKWFGTTDNGMSLFDGYTWTHYGRASGLPDDCVNDIVFTPDGTMWIATGHGAVSYSDGTTTVYTTDNSELPDNYINCMEVTAGGAVWFGTSYGAAQFSGGQWTVYNSDNGLLDNYVMTIAVKGLDVLMSSYVGTSVLHTGSDTWSYYTTDNGFSSNAVAEILVDQGGVLWLGTVGSGIDRVYGESIVNYTLADGIVNDNIICGAVDLENGKWFGSWDGVSYYNNETWTVYKADNSGLIYDDIRDIAVDADGKKWFATSWGISSLGTQEVVTPPAAPTDFTAVVSPDDEENGISLTWVLSADDDAIAGYGIYRSRAAEFTDPVSAENFETTEDLIEAEETSTILIAAVPAGTAEYNDTLVRIEGGTYYYWIASVASDNTASDPVACALPVGVEDAIPLSFDLAGNYPNPFNGMTTINFSIPNASAVKLAVYNIAGQKIRELHAGKLAAGQHSIVWDGRNDYGQTTSSGVYIARLESNGHVDTARMLFMK